MAPKVLLQQRIVASASAASLVTVSASSYGTQNIQINPLINGLQRNEVVKIRILAAQITTDDNSSLVVQNANLQADGQKLIQPAFSGSPLGRANQTAFSGEINFHSNDILPDNNFGASLQILLQNTDAGGSHSVTAASVTFEVIRTQWDEPTYGDSMM